MQLERSAPLARTILAATLLLAALSATPARAAETPGETPNPLAWVTNGPVYAIASTPSTIYLGGTFSYVGPATGGGAAISAATGLVTGGFPKVDGAVYAFAPDGAGGWYIGGQFRHVGAFPKYHLAHILADGRVDESWEPFAGVIGRPTEWVNANVGDLAVVGGTVYVAGGFSTMNGIPRNNLAALDAASGELKDWNPNPDGGVAALAISDGTLYVGGRFRNIGGQPRRGLAALNIASGSATAWNPNASGDYLSVMALAVAGGTVYAGGGFSSIGGQARNGLAAIDAASGAIRPWKPNANEYSNVFTLAVSGGTVYAGGDFTSIGGQARNRLAALDAASGAVMEWNPNSDGYVYALTVSGGTIYAGGGFSSISGQARNRLAAFDAVSGALKTWNPSAENAVLALGVSGGTVYAGGEFISAGGKMRHYLAALDTLSGAATGWNPNANLGVTALTVAGGTVYAGGFFTSIDGKTRNHLAALDAVSGAPSAWNPSVDGEYTYVQELAIWGETLYAGGEFSSISGYPRDNLAALDLASGTPTAWRPNPNGRVNALAISRGTLYAGGAFSSIGGQPRNLLAAMDLANGAVTAWNPNADYDPEYSVNALEVAGGTLYAGGCFRSIGGQERGGLAAVDVASGSATAWYPNSRGKVYALAVSGGTVYAAGTIISIGGETRYGLAAMDALSGAALDWKPKPYDARALAVSGGTVYAGGDFTSVNGLPQHYLARFDVPPLPLAGVRHWGGYR